MMLGYIQAMDLALLVENQLNKETIALWELKSKVIMG